MNAQTIHERCRYSKYAPRQYHFPAETLEGTLERTPGFVSLQQVRGHEGKVFHVGFVFDRKTGMKTYFDGRQVEDNTE